MAAIPLERTHSRMSEKTSLGDLLRLRDTVQPDERDARVELLTNPLAR